MIIAYAGQKGGSGKSTLAIATASELHRRGHRTLLVDADPQGTSATWGAVAAEHMTEDPDYTYPDVVMMGANLHKQLLSVAQGYDMVIIDCPGRDDARQRGALAVADVAIVPVTPDTSDVWALSGTLELVQQARTFRPDLMAALLLNKMRAGTVEANEARDMLSEANLPILNSELGLRITYGRFAHSGQGVAQFKPGGKASLEIKALVSELEERFCTTPDEGRRHEQEVA